MYVCRITQRQITMESASKTKFKTVEEYFAAQPSANRIKLEEMRNTIRAGSCGPDRVTHFFELDAVGRRLCGKVFFYGLELGFGCGFHRNLSLGYTTNIHSKTSARPG